MTSFFHDLEDQLRSAARERTSDAPVPGEPPRRRRGGWLRGGIRLMPVAAAVAVTLAVVGGALVLLGHRGGQPPTPPAGGRLGAIFAGQSAAQVQRELWYIARATRPAQQSAACRQTLAARVHVRLIKGRPSQALLGVLGVLRRRPTAADHLPMHLLDADQPVYAGSIRRAFRAQGTSYYIYVEHDTGSEYPSDRCIALQVQAFNRALPTIPLPWRARTRTLEAHLVAYERKVKALAPQDTLCFMMQAHNGESTSCGIPASTVTKAGVAPESLTDSTGGIVPDGVASVTLRYPARAGRPAQSFTSTVHGNVYATGVGGVPGTPGSAPTMIWRDAGGRVLKVITPPTAADARKACLAHPVACLTVQGASSERSSGSESATAVAPPTPHPKSGG